MKQTRFKLYDIRRIWDQVKPDIAYLQSRYNMDWKPEDVYAQCLMGLAFCYVCDNGFLIVKPHENPFTLEKELFVWIACGEGDDLIAEYQSDIGAIAADIYATSIIFESPRAGWRKKAESQGWQQGMTTYRIPVI